MVKVKEGINNNKSVPFSEQETMKTNTYVRQNWFGGDSLLLMK